MKSSSIHDSQMCDSIILGQNTNYPSMQTQFEYLSNGYENKDAFIGNDLINPTNQKANDFPSFEIE